MSKKVIFLAYLIGFSFIYGCDDPPPTGCHIYNHIFQDELHFHVEYDSISLYFCAAEYYVAPIGIAHIIDNQLSDSLIIYINAYGRSIARKPNPYDGHVWYSDSLVVWYSGIVFNELIIESHFGTINRTPPCPIYNEYWIDYIQLRHSDNLVVDVDGTVRN